MNEDFQKFVLNSDLDNSDKKIWEDIFSQLEPDKIVFFAKAVKNDHDLLHSLTKEIKATQTQIKSSSESEIKNLIASIHD